jgi:hypothetical protein
MEQQLGFTVRLPGVSWQDGDATVVSIANPRAMFQIVDQRPLEPIVDEAERRLRAVAAELSAALTAH